MTRTKRAGVAVLAATGMLAAVPAMSMVMGKLPPETKHGAISYVSGGIGHREAAAFRSAESRYPLSLEFIQRAKPRDEYLANVHVTIEGRAMESKGKPSEWKAMANGPYFLAKLPDGAYTIRAEENGQTKVRHVTIAANKPEHVTFEW